jgi:hypothetical protein
MDGCRPVAGVSQPGSHGHGLLCTAHSTVQQLCQGSEDKCAAVYSRHTCPPALCVLASPAFLLCFVLACSLPRRIMSA